MRAIFGNMRNLISSKYIGSSRLFNNGSNTVESGKGNGLHNHNWLGSSGTGRIFAFSPITEGFEDQIHKDLSLGIIMLFCTSIFLWLVYGILMKNSPIIIANFLGSSKLLLSYYSK